MLIGAYATVILMDEQEQLGFVDSTPWPFWACIIVSGVVAGALGFALGFPALRLSGPYLAIATLALIIATPSILRKYDDVTGGAQGLFISQPPPPPGLEDSLNDDEWIYLLFLLVATVMMLIAWSIVRGPLGRAFVAVRDSETAAAAMGVNVARTKVTAFTISAFYAGVAGALFALQNEVVTPDSITIAESINFLTAIVIGGLASILGSIIGAFVLVLLTVAPEFIAKLPFLSENTVKTSSGIIQGILVILVVLLMPYGIAGVYHRLVHSTPAGVWAGVSGIPHRIGVWGSGYRRQLALDMARLARDLRPPADGDGPPARDRLDPRDRRPRRRIRRRAHNPRLHSRGMVNRAPGPDLVRRYLHRHVRRHDYRRRIQSRRSRLPGDRRAGDCPPRERLLRRRLVQRPRRNQTRRGTTSAMKKEVGADRPSAPVLNHGPPLDN